MPPKQKIQMHKGQLKHAVKQVDEGNPSDNVDSEYVTVVDFENKKKYDKRAIKSNWAKYETSSSDINVDREEESPDTNDLGYLIKNASSDYSNFEFNSEKLWKKEANIVPSNDIFSLNLTLLSSGLACLPFYERINLDCHELSIEDVSYFDSEAEKNLELYKTIKESFNKKSLSRSYNKNTPSDDNENKTVSSPKVKADCKGSSENEKKMGENNQGNLHGSHKNVTDTVQKSAVNTCSSEKTSMNAENQNIMSTDDKDLEDWLDSVLDS